MFGKYDRSKSGVKRNHWLLWPVLPFLASWTWSTFFDPALFGPWFWVSFVLALFVGWNFGSWRSPKCPECGMRFSHRRYADSAWSPCRTCSALSFARR